MRGMDTVSISKSEYATLKRQAQAYRQFAARFFNAAIKDNIADLVEDFRNTDLYTDTFLGDLESGLRKSSYGKA